MQSAGPGPALFALCCSRTCVTASAVWHGSPAARGPKALSSDEFHFNDEDDAKSEIRAAVRYLLNGAAGSDRRDAGRRHAPGLGAGPQPRGSSAKPRNHPEADAVLCWRNQRGDVRMSSTVELVVAAVFL